jgi:hypothetical protein
MARAISSFPVPLSPRMRMVESVAATFRTRSSTRRIGSLNPMMFSNVYCRIACVLRWMFSFRMLVSSRARPTRFSTATTLNGFVM